MDGNDFGGYVDIGQVEKGALWKQGTGSGSSPRTQRKGGEAVSDCNVRVKSVSVRVGVRCVGTSTAGRKV